MRVIIISDTHDNISLLDKLDTYITRLRIETLFHLGDYVSPFTLRKLLSILEKSNVDFLGIFGNNDGDKVLMLKTLGNSGKLFEPPAEADIDYLKVLVLHGFGPKDLTDRFVNSLALSRYYDLIIYGHTHTPRIDRIDGTVVLNPGAFSGYLTESPTLAFLDTDERSLAIIDLHLSTVTKELIFK
ncbi:MAG: metallophosphoesterase [Sulfolobales archaeon]|nr:metallophosphoesterase [Sulfolobales archaeon]MCX8185590.1 metallophosphoesterase [Sulfolobales archaeon]MDW7969533.1 metallophosphoesterase [Sulfolobales archaeon]